MTHAEILHRYYLGTQVFVALQHQRKTLTGTLLEFPKSSDFSGMTVFFVLKATVLLYWVLHCRAGGLHGSLTMPGAPRQGTAIRIGANVPNEGQGWVYHIVLSQIS